eukprot:11900569-Prorocentrum_lima.AAC.1
MQCQLGVSRGALQKQADMKGLDATRPETASIQGRCVCAGQPTQLEEERVSASQRTPHTQWHLSGDERLRNLDQDAAN